MKYTILLFLSLTSCFLQAQSKLVVNGAYINLNGGTVGTPIYLVVEDSSSNGVIRNSGHIISASEYNYLKRNFDSAAGPFLFPFGYTTTDYIPFTVNKTSANQSRLAVSTWSTDAANNPRPNGVTSMIGSGDSLTSAVDRFWRLTPDAALTANYTPSYRGAENTVTNPTTSNLVTQYWASNNWQAPSTGGNVGVTVGVGNTSGIQALTAGSYPLVLTRAGFPLPIDLLKFNAIWADNIENIAQLDWEVGEEQNLSYYRILRSLDGINYDSISRVEKGDLLTKTYQYLDQSIPKNAHQLHYKIVAVDQNGSEQKSPYRLLTRSAFADLIIQAYPNPFNENLEISFSHIPKGETALVCYDINGKIVYSEELFKRAQYHSINLKHLAAGTYHLVVKHQNKQTTFRIQKFN